jgi:histone H1/5
MSYREGIITAIAALKDRQGSSMIAIKKHMQANLPKDKKWLNATFLAALKTGVTSGDLVQVKSSYKLSADFKKKAEKAAKAKAEPKVKKSTVAKKASKKKVGTATKKTATKKATSTKKVTTKATKKTVGSRLV